MTYAQLEKEFRHAAENSPESDLIARAYVVALKVHSQMRGQKLSPDDQDVFQNMLVAVVRAAKRYVPGLGAKWETYVRYHLVGAVLNSSRANYSLRRSGRKVLTEGLGIEESSLLDQFDSASETDRDILIDIREIIDRAVSLKGRWAEVISLRYGLRESEQPLSFAEIGERFDRSEAWAKRACWKAIQELRSRLGLTRESASVPETPRTPKCESHAIASHC